MSFGQVFPEGQATPTCYRHSQTVSYVSCHRCGRPVCPQCQVSAPVGVQCVDCVAQANKNLPRQKTQFGGRARSGAPVITYTFIGLNVLVYLLQWIIPGFTNQLVLAPALAAYEPWRLITSAFAHSTSSFLHLAMNMYGVYIFGTMLEPRMGRLRFTWLYLLSAFGGSLGVLLLSNPISATLGASGALAGLFLATFVVFRSNKQALRSMGIILALNVVLGFVIPSISWQGHLGGAILGILAACCIVLIPRSNPQRARNQILLLTALSIALLAALYLSTEAVKWPLG
ncbi:rhomboid family intramembrane serine protease [Arthrobacter sp. MYb214]|nr:rhomboid family intramembrane serine protease [Arthrobacter sp. MYb222]PRB75102.1 rhomboid family intramembrane serine protease [Arthrobacter sp. MYb214]TDU27002.1 membrane associated rhomboid family serine protease [Arthrobacter sp. JUb115]